MAKRWYWVFTLLLLINFTSMGRIEADGVTPPGNFVPRANYGARLEIPDKILHGAGQDPLAFHNYFNVMTPATRPILYMTYVNLNGDLRSYFAWLKREIERYNTNENIYLIPQIGLSMTSDDGHPQGHYEGAVAAGRYDSKIQDLCDGIASLGHPAFLRIGYEFNGAAWNGYKSDTYKQAFIRITEQIRENHLEVATVWDAYADASLDSVGQAFYPGDDYVDWWGLNFFSASELTLPEALRFLSHADAHGKPVMIGESTPRYVGVTRGQDSWNKWFASYFNLIRSQKMIKAFCYIDWNWASYSQWRDWGDARVESNPTVNGNYRDEMADSCYYHGTTEANLRKDCLKCEE